MSATALSLNVTDTFRITFLQNQIKSIPVLHRLLHRLCPCIPHPVVHEDEGGQGRVVVQRLRDREGSLETDGVVPEVEGGHGRVDLQRLRDRPSTVLADAVVL